MWKSLEPSWDWFGEEQELKPDRREFKRKLQEGLPLWLSWLRICLQCGRPGFDPWVGKITWRREGYPLQYSGLENSMGCLVYGVAKSQTRMRDWTEAIPFSRWSSQPRDRIQVSLIAGRFFTSCATREVIKNFLASTGDMSSIRGLGRSPGEGNGNSLQYSCLGNPTDRGARWAKVHGLTKESDTA